MRETQLMGLSVHAQEIIKAEEVKIGTRVIEEIYDDGSDDRFTEPITRDNPCQTHYDDLEGMFEELFPLWRYTFDDGTILEEYVQAQPWSSGPCFFIALKDSDGNVVKESLWDEKTINDVI